MSLLLVFVPWHCSLPILWQDRSTWQILPSDDIYVHPSLVKADFNYYTEQFTDEQDFSYLNDKLYDISQDDFSAYTVSPIVKARFKFPTKDPSPNLITDNRTSAQIVSDILRIWCQCLTLEEKQVWNLIADRDLTKTLTLSSGLRTPKSFIDRDINNFCNLQNTEKKLC